LFQIYEFIIIIGTLPSWLGAYRKRWPISLASVYPIKQQRCQLPLKGKGALLWDENNKEYIDAIASWWVNP
jgi:acetylornithine/succinyldiaminopimelate/putrescine aminotransferase